MARQRTRGVALTERARSVSRNWLVSAPAVDVPSEPELAVRADADKLERVVVGFAIDENEIRPDVAVAAVPPGATQRMIAKAGRQRRVGRQEVGGVGQQRVQPVAVWASFLALEIAAKAGGRLNRPH